MEITYKWTKKRFLEASKANYDYKLRALKFRLLGYFGLIFIVFGVYIAYSKGVYAILIVSTLLVIYWYFLRWPLYRLQLSLQFKRHASKDQTISWSVDNEFFSISSESGGGKYNWDGVTDLVETKTGFIIRHYPVFYWLPKECFESNEDIEWFRSNIMENVGDRK